MPKLRWIPGGKRRLRNLVLVNPRYQTRYIFYILLTGTVIIGNYTFLLFHSLRNFLAERTPPENLPFVLEDMLLKLAAAAGAFILLLSVVVLVLSHHTAGMMFRFKQVIDAVKAGDTSARISLRKNDDFPETAQAFNEMMDALESKARDNSK